MDSDRSQPSSPLVSEVDFSFAFNDVNFSDRLLRIEITSGGSLPSFDDGDGFRSSFRVRDRKRKREHAKKDNNKITSNVLDLTESPEEHELNENQPDSDDRAATENQDEETLVMMEDESQSDIAFSCDEDAGDELNWRMDCCTTVERVEEMHISSPILAAKSPFFYKLFSNGMGESVQRHVTLRVDSSEEAALMELLKFMYSNTLSVTSAAALIDVLMAAHKFEVASCVRYCSRLLGNMPMTLESAMLYLVLPSNVVMAETVQPLMDASRQFLATRMKDKNWFKEEVTALPLTTIEAILSSDKLEISSEDAVYDIVVKWARTHYPVLEERRDILRSRLARCIRFPYMTYWTLRKVLTSEEFDHDFLSKLVLEALFFKAEAPHRQHSLTADGLASSNRRFIGRAYKLRPIMVLEFELPRPQCLVYLDLNREDCASLYPKGRVYSQLFHLGGEIFLFSADCSMDQQSSLHYFGMFLGMHGDGSASFSVDYEFALRSEPTEEFVSKDKGNYTFSGRKVRGIKNLIPWASFIAEDSPYFINGVLHLKVELTIRN